MTAHRISVLVVDDSDCDRELFAYALRKAEVEWSVVAEIEDGVDAIAYLQGDGKYGERVSFPYPDLLMLDLKMPKRTGFEVLDWLQSQPRRPLTVVLSGSNRGDDMKKALSLGADYYQVKPNELQDFVLTVQRLHALLTRSKVPEDETAVALEERHRAS